MKTVLAVASLVTACSSIWIVGQTLPDENQVVENAAVKYLRANASLRQSYPLAPDAAAKLETALDSPLDDEDERLVAAASDALAEFGHAAGIQRCDWAMSIGDGPLANTAHRGAIRELVAVSGLRARMRFRNGDTSGAVNDVLAAMAATRHLSVDGSLASVLISYKLEKVITGVLARNLHKLSPRELQEVASGLDTLPGGSSMAVAFEMEKVGRDDSFFMAIVQGAKNRYELIERLASKIPALHLNKVLAAEIVDGCGGSIAGFGNCINQQHSFYASWAKRFMLPPEQFETAYKTQIKSVSSENPIVRQFTPNLPRFRWAEMYSQTRRALLRGAIAVRLDGPAALPQHLDPYDKNPFSYVKVDGGFRLESRLIDSGIPLALSVVPEGQKQGPVSVSEHQ